MQRAAPATAAALARVLGPLGGRLAMGLNIVGGSLAAVEILGLLARGANGVERCRTQEIDFKRHIIEQMNERGQQFREALQQAGFTLTAQQIRQLQYPPAYLEPERLNNILCSDIVAMAREVEQRQNRVYSEITEGTMVIVPLPPEPSRELSESDQQLLDEFIEGMRCLQGEDYIRGVCAVGAFVMFARPLPRNLRHLDLPEPAAHPMFARWNTRTQSRYQSIRNGFTEARQRDASLDFDAYLTRRGNDRFRSLNPQQRQRVLSRVRRCLALGAR